MLCSKEFPEKVVMLDHLKNHSKFAKLFQPPNINNTTNKSVEDVVSPGKISIKSQVNVKQEIIQQKVENVLIWNSSSVDSKVVKNLENDKEHKRIQKDCKKRHGCRFCDKKFTQKQSAKRHEKTHDQTNSTTDGNIGKYDCKYCDKKFTQKGSAKRHEKTYHTKGGSIQEQLELLQYNSSEFMGMDVPKPGQTHFSPENEEDSLSSSFQSFATNFQEEIPQQESLIKKELIQIDDQI